MASFAYVQGTGASSLTAVFSQPATLTGVTVGDLIVVIADCYDTVSSPTVSISDSQSNSWNTAVTQPSSYNAFSFSTTVIFWTIVTTGGTVVVTISSTVSSRISFSFDEYSFTSGATVSLGDTSSFVKGTGSTTPLISLSSTQTCLAVGGWDVRTTGLTYTAGSGYTLGYTDNSVSTAPFLSEYNVSQTSGSFNVEATLSSSSAWSGVAAAFLLTTSVNIYSSDSSISQESSFFLNHVLDVDSGLGAEGTYAQLSISVTDIFDSDSSIAVDQQIVINSFINSDQSQSIDIYLLSQNIYSKEQSFADQANDPITSNPSIISIQSSDSAIALESQSTHNVLQNYDSDSAFASESQFVIGQFFYSTESPSAIESQFPEIFAGDFSLATDKQVFASAIFCSSDSAIESENQLTMITGGSSATVFDKNPTVGLEAWLRIIRIGDLATGIEKQTSLTTIITAGTTEASSGIESQIPIRLSGEFSSSIDPFYFFPTVFSVDTGIAREIFILSPIVFSTENPRAVEAQFLTKSFILVGSGIIDSATGMEAALPIRLPSNDSSSGNENQYSIILSGDDSHSRDAFTFSTLVIQTDNGRGIETSIIFKNFILVGSGIVDSAIGAESALPIRISSGDLGSGNEYQYKIILGGLSTTDLISGTESILKIIFNLESPIARDMQFLFFSTMSTSSAGAESAIGQESQLKILRDGESPTSIDQQFKILLDINTSFATDKQTVLNFSVNAGAAETESALASEAFQRVMIAGDFGSVVNTGDTSTGMLPVAPVSSTSITDVLNALLIYLNSTGVVGPSSIDYVIDPDSVTLWPTNPGPLLLIEPLELRDAGDTIGGGRYSKTWTWEITIHVIVDNIYDSAFKDIFINESYNYQTGPFQLAYQVQTLVEQAYLVNSWYQPVLIEFPYFLSTEKIRRYKGANSYAGIPIRFMVVFRDNLPSLNIP